VRTTAPEQSGKDAARRLRKGHARPRRAIGRRSLQDLQIHAMKCHARNELMTVRSVQLRFGCAPGRATEMIAALLEDKKLEEVEPGKYIPSSDELTKMDPASEGDEP
jgi:hypothetical protein